MSTTATASTVLASGCHLFSGCPFPAPSADSFVFSPLFKIGGFGFTWPMLLCLIASASVCVFFFTAFRAPKLVPRGAQNVGELGYLFIRDQIARPMIGEQGDTFVPFLFSLFFFIWTMNLMEIIPIAAFPVTSKIAFPMSLVAMVYVTYWFQAIKHYGFFGFLRSIIPSGVPVGVLVLLVPVEWLRVLVIQPFTLTIRLFANMFSGHLLVAVFVAATWYLASASIGALFSAGSAVMIVVITGFEMVIQALQAFIFTMLTAQYIGESHAAGH
ncbi:MAG TPA: F0F1 ATP synthase subunit A [Actinocrinis sp.]